MASIITQVKIIDFIPNIKWDFIGNIWSDWAYNPYYNCSSSSSIACMVPATCCLNYTSVGIIKVQL